MAGVNCAYQVIGIASSGKHCYRCAWCDHERESRHPPERLHRKCPKAPALEPEAKRLGIAWEDVEHYAEAIRRWVIAGRPTRTQAEVKTIYAEHCEPCDDHIDGRCKKCRCCVNVSRIALVNKIKMASEHCPDEKW